MIAVQGPRILLKADHPFEDDKTVKQARAAIPGLVIPEMEQRKAQAHVDSGVVVDIGPTVSSEYVRDLKVGDRIGFAKYGGKYITDPTTDEQYLVINDDDVICVFTE